MKPPPAFSDQALALEFVKRFGTDYRYVADVGLWHHWTGSIWERDRKNVISTPVAQVCSDNAAKVEKDAKLKRGLASNSRRRAVIDYAAQVQRVVVTHDQLDADKTLLGTPTGFIDLETGEHYEPERERLITMSTSVDPANDAADCPLFADFLNTTYPQVPGEEKPDEEIIAFLKRYLGYSLTASVQDHAFIFLLGAGRNGKGVLTHTVQKIMGSYATVLNAESLMERPLDPHLSEFAELPGKRLILCREVSPGKYWSYSRLMGMVAGDPMRANFMHQNPFTFFPVGKLIVEANNRPAFRVITPAVEGRFILLRHNMRFVRKEKLVEGDPTIVEAIPTLEDALATEYPAILRWMIEGAIEYFRDGLQIPQSILSDSDDYLREQDDEGAWIKEQCRAVSGSGDRRKDLFDSYNIWRIERGQKPEDYHQFGDHLRDIHGFKIKHANYGDQVVGLVLNDFARMALNRHRKGDAAGQMADAPEEEEPRF